MNSIRTTPVRAYWNIFRIDLLQYVHVSKLTRLSASHHFQSVVVLSGRLDAASYHTYVDLDCFYMFWFSRN